MTYTYCAEKTSLADAEIVAIIRHLRCCDTGEVDEGALDMLRLEAGCDLAQGHAGPHAGYQASGAPRGRNGRRGEEVYGWLFWGGVIREIGWPAECPVKSGDGFSCLLFDQHEGPHLHYEGEQEAPAWLRHTCPTKPWRHP